MRSTSTVLEVILLALWLGAGIIFSAVVAPAAFAVLPTRMLAGALVGRVLPVIFISGMAVGALVIALAGKSTVRRIAGAIVVGGCATAQFVIAPRIARLRAEIGGVLENLAPDDARRAAFGRLHAMSVGWLGLAMLAAAVALVLAARTLTTTSNIDQ
jgi:hypothetical protein